MAITYKCPGCGAGMVFDSKKQMLVCEHCGTTKMVDETEQQQESKQFKEDIKVYHCSSCGAELLTDLHTAATFCNYCGSSTLIEDRLSGERAPAMVIPFKTNKAQAKEAYLKWAKKGLLTPSDFVSQSTVEKITGIYVPFWLYDYETETQANIKATRIRMERVGDMEYTHTDHFHLVRDIEAEFCNIPVDASENMDDEIMDKLEPFNYEEMVEFEMPYLAGYLAEKYNFTKEQIKGRAEGRINRYADSILNETITGYATTHVENKNIFLQSRSAEYVMFPVWMLSYLYQGKKYMFTMNGQTGKVVGELPFSKQKILLWFCIIFVITFLILFAVGWFL